MHVSSCKYRCVCFFVSLLTFVRVRVCQTQFQVLCRCFTDTYVPTQLHWLHHLYRKVVPVLPIVPLVPHQFHQLYRTSFTSAKKCTKPSVPKKQRTFCRKRHQFYRKQRTFYKKQRKHFGAIQSAHRFGAIQWFSTFGTLGAVQLVHLVQYKWYTQCSIGDTAGTRQALITHLVQCIVNS